MDPSDVSNSLDRYGEVVASRRQRLLATRKQNKDSSALPDSQERSKRMSEMLKQCNESEYAVDRLHARVSILDLMVTKHLPDDAFLGRRELAPKKFEKNDHLSRKWEFVNNMVTLQEFLVAIKAAKDRKNQALLNEPDTNLSFKSPRGCPDGKSTKSIEVAEAGIRTESGECVDSSYPVLGKATVYPSDRRSCPKTSKPKPTSEIVERLEKSEADEKPKKQLKSEVASVKMSLLKKEQAILEKRRFGQRLIVLGLDSHHRLDVGHYCSRSLRAGLRNRKQQRTGANYQFTSAKMKQRIDDITAIYSGTLKKTQSFRRKNKNNVKKTEK